MTETAKKATTPKKPRATAAKTTTPIEAAPKTNGAAPKANGAAPKKTAPKKKTTTGEATPIKASHEEIAMLAHRFWMERGGQHGRHEDDWRRAEQELRGKAS